MSYKTAAYATTVLAVFLMCSATARELPNENLQPTAAQGSNLRLTSDGPGRYRLTGRVVDSNNRLACGLALASGKCMFSCGPGSPRCEGGIANLPYGEFDLRDLPTEPDGTIMLQTFVAGNLPGRQVLRNGTPTVSARWTAVNLLCCSGGGTLTYTVTIDGVSRRSVSTSCNTDSTVEGWATTTAGPKAVSARLSGCASANIGGNATLTANLCHVFVARMDGQTPVTALVVEPCPASLNAAVSTRPEQTPMALYPFTLDGEASGLELLQQNSQSPAIE